MTSITPETDTWVDREERKSWNRTLSWRWQVLERVAKVLGVGYKLYAIPHGSSRYWARRRENVRITCQPYGGSRLIEGDGEN